MLVEDKECKIRILNKSVVLIGVAYNFVIARRRFGRLHCTMRLLNVLCNNTYEKVFQTDRCNIQASTAISNTAINKMGMARGQEKRKENRNDMDM